MIQLNDEFLSDVGLATMPIPHRAAFLEHVYETLELRVGSALSESLSDEQLTEFEAIIDRRPQLVAGWVEMHAPDFESDPIYQRLYEQLAQRSGPSEILCEYAATKWLEVNRSDYRTVVERVLKALSAEVKASAPEILAGLGNHSTLATEGST
jgi:hypothetical protein